MAKIYTISEAGLALIKQWEGLKLTAYRDVAGIPTIGYGHTLGVTRADVDNQKTITEAEATRLLRQDVSQVEKQLNRLITDTRIDLTQSQYDALVSFIFNVGFGAFSKSTLLKQLYLMNIKDSESVFKVADQLLRWKYAGGKVFAGLLNRRKAERALFLRGFNE